MSKDKIFENVYTHVKVYFLLFPPFLYDLSSLLNSLFHVVVENDEASTQIIKHLNSMKGGRVTFIPLNRVTAPRINYPQSSDVIPLLKKLKFPPNYAAAFAHVSLLLSPSFSEFPVELDITLKILCRYAIIYV